MGIEQIRELKNNKNLPKEKKVKNLIRNNKQKNIELEKWFLERKKEMTGICQNCGGKTEKNTKQYKCSAAHILPKSKFKSVSTHPLNFIELCFYGRSCHTNFDNKIIDIDKLNCYDEVLKKIEIMYPILTNLEKGMLPEIVLKDLKKI